METKARPVLGNVFAIGLALALVLIPTALLLSQPVYATSSPQLDSGCAGDQIGSSGTSLTASCTVSSTTGTSDVIIIEVASYSGIALPVIDTPTCSGTGCPSSITFRDSTTQSDTNAYNAVAEYYGTTSSALSSAIFSVTTTNTNVNGQFSVIMVLPFSGADTSSPFPSASAAHNQGTTGTPSVTLTASATDLTLIGFESDIGTTTQGTGSGFSLFFHLVPPSNTGQATGEYEYSSAGCGGGCSIGFADTVDSYCIIGDAIQSTAGVPVLPFGVVFLIAPVVVIYLYLRRSGVERTRGPKGAASAGDQPTRYRPLAEPQPRAC